MSTAEVAGTRSMRGRRRRRTAGPVVMVMSAMLAAALLAAGCGSTAGGGTADGAAAGQAGDAQPGSAQAGDAQAGDAQAGDAPAGDAPEGAVLVFAAASLTDAFGALADAFSENNPQAEVVLNLAGSQTLARQIVEGAPAEVFAAANELQMDVVADAGELATDPEVFATNRLAIAVEPGNPLGITGLDDLADPELLLVLPDEQVPAGRYARQVLDAAGIAVAPVSLEQDVRAARSKVELGEADATIVYASDVVAADGRVDGVEVADEHNLRATYPIARLADSSDPEVAEGFMAFVLSERGREILAEYGFTAP
ncbi:MAG: molybdate ABC transporter substrate-binding protein [Nitriliruptoraceae bacterium]